MFTYANPLDNNTTELVLAQPPDLLRHSKAVATLASRLSIVAGCSPAEQDRIRMGSLLHDIGKQFIPRSILEKKGKLTPAEYKRMQDHPQIGHNYLYEYISDATVLQTVLYHHERWNGDGYPFGLREDQIPLEARICAIADVWDALVSDRCYRSAWNDSQAMELIWAGAGNLFDPLLVSQFLSIVEEERLGGGITVIPEPTPIVSGPFAPALGRTPETIRRGGFMEN